MQTEDTITLMDRARIGRTVKRMAYQISEKARERRIVLVGLNERGDALARQLSSLLGQACKNEQVLLSLNTERVEEEARAIAEKHDLSGSVLILIDDVIYTGDTMFTALQHLPVQTADAVYIAVLIDRGHRKRPVASQFVGMEIPTKPKEHIEMVLVENDPEKIILYRQ